jgi:hypothetical protein
MVLAQKKKRRGENKKEKTPCEKVLWLLGKGQ